MSVQVHELKILEDFATAILVGDKPFEIRKNDRGFQKGDLISFWVINSKGLNEPHELNNRLYEITYVLNGFGLRNDYVCLGIKRFIDE